MAFATDVTNNGGIPTTGTGSTKTFTVKDYPGPGRSTRIDTASTLSAPYLLELAHRSEGKDSGKRTVHVCTFRMRKLNATTGDPIEGSVTLTVRQPDDATVAQADIEDMMNRIGNFCITDTILRGRLLRSEI